MLRSKRLVVIACVAVILLAFCLVIPAAADNLCVEELAGGGALGSVRLVLAVLLASTVAGLIVVGLLSRTMPR